MYILTYNFKKLKFIKKIKIKKTLKIKNKFLIYYYFRKFLFNKRFNTANTKNKSKIIGSNKKICKQKGLGVARKGNIKNPLFKGGGVIFGPTNKKNYNIKINKKIINLSYKIIINQKIKKNNIIYLKNFFLKENIYKNILKFINKFFYLKDNFLFILSLKDYKKIYKYKNIKNIKFILINNINIFLIKKYKFILINNLSFIKKIYNNV
ncbi:MAG: 50S ribosomal protein L4 [Candidatus Shikimatogenerans sp. Tser]|uniref:Large ribosomal subunit protein uL4 n=1 Tax=Candidatus Shikimatogenerans sp. Tser TaxID=3158568 RepID=A0AAU7QQ63_9FLAO